MKAPSDLSECLRGPDLAGVVRETSPETIQANRKRFAGWVRRLSRLRGEPAGLADLIDDLRKRAAKITKSSYCVYRAVLLQEMQDAVEQGDLTDAQAKSMAQRMGPEDKEVIGSRVPQHRTSAGRQRHIRPDGIAAIVAEASDRATLTYDNLADLFEYGVKCGTRPCELFGARLQGRTLIIPSAKFSQKNERGIGRFREIELLDDFDDFDLDGLSRLLARLAAELATAGGDRTRLVRRYGDALRRLRKKIPWASRLTLRTTRSQFRATMKRAGLSTAELAAALGHGSAETGSNYGAANKGWRPIPGCKPISAPKQAIEKVRPGARTKAKLAKNQPITLTELRSSFGVPKRR